MRTCDIDGCDKKHRAKGLCSSHYNQIHLPNRHQKYVIECRTCGKSWESSRKDGLYCSLECRGAGHWNRKTSRELLHVGVVPFSWLPARHPVNTYVKPRKPHVWYAGNCAWCEEPFIDWQPATRYCSQRCGARAKRARRGHFVVSPQRRLALYERDGWVCQLCLEAVDPDLMTTDPFDDWAPSLDHIKCQSWTTTPDHSDANLRLAHRWCNAVRGDGRRWTEADLRISHVA